MKKIIAVVLALVMGLTLCFALASCGTKEAPEGTSEIATGETAANFATVKEGVLTMATNATFPPYEYIEGDDGAIIGIDAEIAQLIADKLGLKLEIANVEFDSIIAGVSTGKYDFGMAGMSVTEERKQSVNFSETYATGIQAVIVKEDSPIASVDDIASDGSMKIGVQQGTTGAIYAGDTPENGGFGEENVINYKNGPDAVQALIVGKVDCVIIDNEPAKAYVAANEGLKLLETTYVEEDYAACFAKSSTALLDAFNAALAELTASGEIKAIIDKYIPAE